MDGTKPCLIPYFILKKSKKCKFKCGSKKVPAFWFIAISGWHGNFYQSKQQKSQARINVLESHWLDGENILECIGIYMDIHGKLLYNIIEYMEYIYIWNIILLNIYYCIILLNYIYGIYIYIIISNPEKDWEEIDLSMLPPMFFYI